MKIHHVKILPTFYAAVSAGAKRYEVRQADRPYKVGDTVIMEEWHPWQGYTGRTIKAKITHLTRPGEWGLPESICVFGYEVVGIFDGADSPTVK